MKKFVIILAICCFGAASSVQAQSKFDPINPILEDLTTEETKKWIEKDLDDWKAEMGDDLELWNPIQMEFYKQIRIIGLAPFEKKEFEAMEFEDWIKKFEGRQPDEWKVHEMLLFSAIQDMKAGL